MLDKIFNRKMMVVLVSGFLIGGCHSENSMLNLNKAEVGGRHTNLDVHFDYDLIIPVVIKNKRYKFLVDTGTSVTVIDSKLAKKLTRKLSDNELAEIYKRDFTQIRAVSGTVDQGKFDLLKPIDFYIGAKAVRDNEIWIGKDLSLLPQLLGQDVVGIIGMDTIRKFNWTVDNNRHRITIDQDALPASNFQYCSEYFSAYNRAPELRFSLSKYPLYFYLDTGADNGYLDSGIIKEISKLKDIPDDVFIKEKGLMSGADATGLTEFSSNIVKYLSYNKMPLGEMEFSTNSDNVSAVGMDFLSRLERYSLMPARLMFCYDSDSIEKHGVSTLRSIGVRYFDGHIEIFSYAYSDFQKLNIKNGDVILKINNISYPPEKIQDVRHILRSSTQGTTRLDLKRNGKKMVVYI